MKTPNSVALLAIGTELTRGEIANTNGAWLAEQVTALGMVVSSLETVADERSAIVDSLQRCSERCDLVIVTGGLGPTTDDMTSETMADFLGVRLVRNEQVIGLLRQRLAAFKMDPRMLHSNASQADFPQTATLMANDHGTAPGFYVEHIGCRIACMPGVPREMKPMFETCLAPWIRSRAKDSESIVRLRCFNTPESTLNDHLAGLEEQFGVTIGYRAHYPEVQIKIVARSSDPEVSQARVESAAAMARERLSNSIYAEGEVDMPSAVAQLLRSEKLTLSLAESCTGGLVSQLLTRQPASDYLLGGVVSYANQVKVDFLGVPVDLLQQHGAVSEAVARSMASGIRERSGSDIALAITGIAGPTGQTESKPLGLVHIAVAHREGVASSHLNIRNRGRQRVQLHAAWAGLDLVRTTVTAQRR